MLFVGLTGGLACGKSTVAEVLAAKGCGWLSADTLGHEAIGRGQPAYAQLLAEFGPGILGEDGEIARAKLAALAFSGADRLERLNEMVHPTIRRLIAERARQYAARHPGGILVLEAALLLEAFAEAGVNKVVVVDCGEEQQVERFLSKGGSAEEARRRMAAQFTRAERLARADFVIDASGSVEQTRKQAEDLYQKLRELAK
jgi:dephospho-CoA kinase